MLYILYDDVEVVKTTGQQNLHHHHHHILFALFTQCKKLFAAVITRRRGDSGSHRAYGRATSKHKVGNEIFLFHYIVTRHETSMHVPQKVRKGI